MPWGGINSFFKNTENNCEDGKCALKPEFYPATKEAENCFCFVWYKSLK
jgi:hypothetical protein